MEKTQYRREFTLRDLSGMMIMLIVAGGFLTAVILFIFAKRQIMRYSIRNRYSPHYPIGQDSKKSMKREIERRLDSIQRISYEPQLIEKSKYILKPGSQFPPYYYRQKAVDDIKTLSSEIPISRGQRESLRSYLLTNLSSALNGSGQRMIHQFCDMYEHARFDPNEFGEEEYQAYHRLLMKLLDAAKTTKNIHSTKSSPSRTPMKKPSKVQSFLDPSRLRPSRHSAPRLETHDSKKSNARLNLTISTTQTDQAQDTDENEILSISNIHGETGPKVEML